VRALTKTLEGGVKYDPAAVAGLVTKIDQYDPKTDGNYQQYHALHQVVNYGLATPLVTSGAEAAEPKLAQWQMPSHPNYEEFYTDDTKLEELRQSPAIQALAQLTGTDAAKAALDRGYLADHYGLSAEQIQATYEGWRTKYALETFGKDVKTEDEFFDLVKGQKAKEKRGRVALGDLSDRLASAELSGEPVSVAQVYQDWQKGHGAEETENEPDTFLKAGYQIAGQMEGELGKLREPARQVLETLTRFAQGQGSEEELFRIGEALRPLTDQEQDRVMQYVGMAARARQVKLGGAAQVGKNLSQTVVRGFDFIPKGMLASAEDEVWQAQTMLKLGDVWLRGVKPGEKPSLGNIYLPSQAMTGSAINIDLTGRRATPEEVEGLKKEAEETLPVFQIVRRLRRAAQEEVDPILPVAREGTFLGTMERGGYDAAGSAGLLGATAVNPLVGMAAYATDEYDRIRLENPRLDPDAAKGLALAEGAANALLDKLELNRLPLAGRLLKETPQKGWRNVIELGKVYGKQTATEFAQNAIDPTVETVMSAVDPQMEKKDAWEEVKQYLQQAPETLAATGWLMLIGAGALSVRQVKNPGEHLESTLKQAGFSEEQRAKIAAAQTPEEFDQAVQEEMPKRTEENIAAGQELTKQLAAEAAQQNGSAGGPQMTARRQADGTSEWRVERPGREPFVTTSEDLAKRVYGEHLDRSGPAGGAVIPGQLYRVIAPDGKVYETGSPEEYRAIQNRVRAEAEETLRAEKSGEGGESAKTEQETVDSETQKPKANGANPYRNEDGSLKVRDNVEAGLAPDQVEEQRKFRKLLDNQEEADRAYDQLPESQGGKVIGTDISREMNGAFAAGREGKMRHTKSTNELASAYGKDRLWRELQNPKGRKKLLFTAGGVAAGKSTGVSEALVKQQDLVYDGTLRDSKWAIQTIEMALRNGWDVNINYVQRPMELVTRGAIERANRTGRIFPLSSLPEAHQAAQRSILAIAQHFKGNPRVDIDYFLNDGGTADTPATRVSRQDIDQGGKYSYDSNNDGQRTRGMASDQPRAVSDGFREEANRIVEREYRRAVESGKYDPRILELIAPKRESTGQKLDQSSGGARVPGSSGDDRLDAQKADSTKELKRISEPESSNNKQLGRSLSDQGSQEDQVEKNGESQTFSNQFPNDAVGPPIQTTSAESIIKYEITRRFNYVVTQDGKLILGRRNNQQVGGGHIDLAWGEPVLAAGYCSFVGGKLKWMDNTSGHYQPSGESAKNAAEKAFKKAGFDVSGKYVEKYWNGSRWIKK